MMNSFFSCWNVWTRWLQKKLATKYWLKMHPTFQGMCFERKIQRSAPRAHSRVVAGRKCKSEMQNPIKDRQLVHIVQKLIVWPAMGRSNIQRQRCQTLEHTCHLQRVRKACREHQGSQARTKPKAVMIHLDQSAGRGARSHSSTCRSRFQGPTFWPCLRMIHKHLTLKVF